MSRKEKIDFPTGSHLGDLEITDFSYRQFNFQLKK